MHITEFSAIKVVANFGYLFWQKTAMIKDNTRHKNPSIIAGSPNRPLYASSAIIISKTKIIIDAGIFG